MFIISMYIRCIPYLNRGDVKELFTSAAHLTVGYYLTEGAVGQAIFSRCILSVIMSLILSERDPPGCSPHPASLTKYTVHIYLSLPAVSLFYICPPLAERLYCTLTGVL